MIDDDMFVNSLLLRVVELPNGLEFIPSGCFFKCRL